MSIDHNNSQRIQIPYGRKPATLIVGKAEIGVHIIDQSASDFDVAMPSRVEVEQNQVYVLKTAAGVYETRLASVEYTSDGQNLGLSLIRDLPASEVRNRNVASWQDCLTAPPPTSSRVGMTVRIAVAAVAGSLICVLAPYCMHCFAARPNHESSKYLHDFTEIVAEEVAKAQKAAADAERIAREKNKGNSGGQSEGEKERPHEEASPQLSRQRMRLSAEVLYRLQLSTEQCRRVRSILQRSSSDLAAAEEEIQSILTPQQIQQWQLLAPEEPR